MNIVFDKLFDLTNDFFVKFSINVHRLYNDKIIYIDFNKIKRIYNRLINFIQYIYNDEYFFFENKITMFYIVKIKKYKYIDFNIVL